MEEIAKPSKQIVNPVGPNQMPSIVITHGNKQNDPHGRVVIAEFFDSRFDNAGRAMPRFDMPAKSSDDEFTWDCYRLDIGPTNLIPARRGESYQRSATDNKSGERIFDTPDGFSLECRGLVFKETQKGMKAKPCRPKTKVTREDWDLVGEFLKSGNLITPGQATYEIEWSFLFALITAIRTQRNKANESRP
jgi:hypothetical protein